ncbi:MAG TPA: PA0069 family radical SAM protein [Alphaproteobacteria bacterium]|nr:PA0069 family radical SAM protein [Alphaproteobacteria bacterium]
MADRLQDQPIKGRGAVTNRTGRFEALAHEAIDDGWPGDDPDEIPRIRTTLSIDASRTIITRNTSPDVPFDRSINPYRGCEHGCIYCFARPTHAYWGLSPGLDFETRLFYKPDAPALLDRELRTRGYQPRTIVVGTNTDPYQPIERELRLTREILSVLSTFNHPTGLITKSALVARDIDILASMAAKGIAQVCVSITTLDRGLARRMEPRAATPPRRLETIRNLSGAGIPVAVLTSPMIPGLNDHELECILEAARDAGAIHAGYTLLRLPLEIKSLFEEWLRAHAPHRAGRVLNLIRESREGRLYDPAWGKRMRGQGVHADLLAARFARATARLGLNERRWELAAGHFAPPPRAGDQLSLL